MALVGDSIVEAREAFPDPAQFFPPPVVGAGGYTVAPASGGTIPLGTYYLVITALNQWGETTPSAEQSVVLSGANQTISVSSPASSQPVPIPVIYRVYLGVSPGAEQIYFVGSGGQSLSITSLFVTPNGSGSPPTRNSAMLPDTDGGFVSAYTMYRWLNDGLQAMSRIAGGLPSMTGVNAKNGQSMYSIAGRWIKFTNVWFDGWPVTFGKRGDIFLHNPVIGIPGIVSLEEWADTTLIQFWPQPNRTGANTTLASDISSGVTTIPCTSTSGFLAPGLAQLDFGNINAPLEIISYSSAAGNNLSGVVRGVAGTASASHSSIGSTVLELNIKLSGFRQPPIYNSGTLNAVGDANKNSGDSIKNLPMPPGWEVPLSNYIVAQYRRAEQQEQEAQAMEKEFGQAITALAKLFRGKTGPIQIGSTTREVLPGSVGGGILIP